MYAIPLCVKIARNVCGVTIARIARSLKYVIIVQNAIHQED